MRKVIKSNILGFILGGLIFGSIGIYAANLYNANDISYTTNDGTKTNVNDALNELYNEGSDTGKAILLGTARTYDLSSYPGYQNFTANNFICVVDGFETRVGNSDFSGNIGANTWYYAPTKSYNASTGVFSFSGLQARCTQGNLSGGVVPLSITVYLVY